ncbi:MAG: decaprenyl-phosphate phosphoribosyltransferase [Nitrospira sp.]|nr:decaprenyl-phosphate phosphoribosyltransferase [Nitrospira sp.]
MNPYAQSIIAVSVSSATEYLRCWLKALRVKQWVKNFFVLAPFLMGPQFGENEYLAKSILGALLFCLMSSAVYLLNDLVDVRADRQHPVKRHRPIAAGNISPVLAGVVASVMACVTLVGGAFLDLRFFAVLCLYVVNNLLYSFLLKEKTVIDVMSIAIGFVMRIYAGGFLIDVEVTNWLVVCVFALSLMIGFGKRRSELEDLGASAALTRAVNHSYSVQKLNMLVGSSASITILAYMLYSVSPETKALHGTDKIIFTVPLVVYCIYRFMLKVQEQHRGEPVEVIFHDRGFVLAGLMWLAAMLYLTH